MIKLAIDTGGTFTDFALLTPEGIKTFKLPSTPDDPAKAILSGIDHFYKELPKDIEIIHGTTVGTNAFLERKGARTLLVTTFGFEDVLFIGRQNREKLYDLKLQRPPEIIPRSNSIGVKERILFDGAVQKTLGKTVGKRIRRIAQKIKAESIAICLLHSYVNPEHEKTLSAALTSLDIPITLSSELLPEFREFERTSTTVINAYLAPIISSYIDRLSESLGHVPLHIQQSNGGVLPAKSIANRAVHTILSGPAGGVYGAFQLARTMAIDKIITFDMGGTSTDVSLCDGGLTMTRDYKLDTYPIRIPVIDIHTVGAGGGSIAWIDAGGLLQVGPQSAGADPGPACYGKGDKISVTDANLFLGRLLPDHFLGGRLHLKKDHTTLCMNFLSEQTGLSPLETALGAIKIVNAGMAKAIRKISLERGHDPGEYTLFAFGGAAGLHCCELMEELGIKKTVVPARAGILSAQGMMLSDPTLDYVQTCILGGKDISLKKITDAFKIIETKGLTDAGSLFPANNSITFSRYLDMRYQGQSHEITVPFDEDFARSFHDAHYHLHGYAMEDVPLEIVSVRCTLKAKHHKPDIHAIMENATTAPVAFTEAEIHFTEGPFPVKAFKRKDLLPGHSINGPGLIVDDYTTILLTPQCHLSVDPLLNLVIVTKNNN